jgi:integrase
VSLYRKPRSPFWHFDFWYKNNRFHGSTETGNRREAEKVEAAEREKAKETVAQNAAAKTSLRLDDVAGRYWQTAQHFAGSRNTWKRLSLLIEFFGEDKRIPDITDDNVTALIAWRRGHRAVRNRKNPKACPLITNGTVNLTIMQLKTLFATLRPRVQEPKWRKLWLPVVQEHPRELMGDEGDRLEAQMRDDYLPIFEFAKATGMRQSECLLRWREVFWDAGQIRKTGKNGKPVTIPITPTIRAILWPLQGQHCDYVFTYVATRTHRTWIKGKRYPITKSGLRAHWHRLRKESGVVGFRFHDFRHDLGTKALRATGNLKLVQKMMNHADIRHTLRYAHVLDDEIAGGFERVAESRTAASRKRADEKSRTRSRAHLREVG